MAFNPNFQRHDHALDATLEKMLYFYDLPGLAVSICMDDQLYQRALGYQNAITKTPLQIDHVFHMGSVTKLFVGSAILKLWEKELLSLDEPVTTYLPWFRMADPRYTSVTIRHLLSHTSGMPDVIDYHWDQPETDEGALERYVRSAEVSNARLLWDPSDNRFSYSNMAYEVLGVIIATVSGHPFEEYITKEFLRPLKMEQSTLLTFERSMEDVCAPHEKNEANETILSPHFPYNRAHGPSSTLTSTVGDLNRWARAHLEQRVLKRQTYQEAWAPQARVPNNGEEIGLSWFHRVQKGYSFFGHEGMDDGFRASFWICPALDLSMIVCSNLSEAPVKKISKELFNLLLDEKAE